MFDRRKEARVRVNLVVQVWGLDESGNLFNQSAHATDISRSGALLLNMRAVRPGDLIVVRHGSKQARFRIVWTKAINRAEGIEVAVHKLSTEVCPWAEHLDNAPDDNVWGNS